MVSPLALANSRPTRPAGLYSMMDVLGFRG